MKQKSQARGTVAATSLSRAWAKMHVYDVAASCKRGFFCGRPTR